MTGLAAHSAAHAFVYGSLSFLDKMACGLALYILESYEKNQPCHSGRFSITRFGVGLLPAVCALLGVVITYTMKLHKPEQKTLTEPLLV
uniref:Uncharacterized protein n=1 Tax=Kalanchoe fedtschenkoi TaxID=63787 RepID=A0A7N0TZ90_KALFE